MGVDNDSYWFWTGRHCNRCGSKVYCDGNLFVCGCRRITLP